MGDTSENSVRKNTEPSVFFGSESSLRPKKYRYFSVLKVTFLSQTALHVSSYREDDDASVEFFVWGGERANQEADTCAQRGELCARVDPAIALHVEIV